MDMTLSDNEDNIRPPDDSVSEQLLEDNRSDFEKDIDEAIYLSCQEMREKEISNRKYEEQIVNDYNDETNKRKKDI